MNKLLSIFNLNELGFDMALLLMSAFTWLMIFPQGVVPLAEGNTLIYQHFIVLAEFVFAFVLGREGQYFAKGFLLKGKWRKYYYYSAVLYILAVAYLAIPIVLNAAGIFSYAVGFFACIMGYMTGTSVWKEDSYVFIQKKSREERIATKRKITENSSGNSTFAKYERYFESGFEGISSDYPLLMGIPFLVLFYGIVYFVNIWSGFQGFKGVLAYIGIMFIPVLLTAIFFFIVLVISLFVTYVRDLWKPLDVFLMKFFFPMLFALLFLVWNKIYFYYVIGENAPLDRLILFSIFLGLIPYRFLLMIRPPVKINNICVAIVSFIIYYAANI